MTLGCLVRTGQDFRCGASTWSDEANAIACSIVILCTNAYNCDSILMCVIKI